MVLEAIYVVRHGYRSNWTVDPSTGHYEANVPSPTGIASDPALASYGVKQAEQLGRHLATLDPPVDLVYSSPFYRCLQTLQPFVTGSSSPPPSSSAQIPIHVEPGLGEFYGLARFDHPSPAPLTELRRHFKDLREGGDGDVAGENAAEAGENAAPAAPAFIIPSTKGESIAQLHDRVAYCLDRLIRRVDTAATAAAAAATAPRTLLICTHAAVMIAIGRALTGAMPDSVAEEDFRCGTCCFTKFVRREGKGSTEKGEEWVAEKAEVVPDVGWRGGRGVGGGWECVVNGDCSFLEGGEERGWSFAMEIQQAGK